MYGLEDGSAEVGPAKTGHSIRAIVLELLEGNTLAGVLARGPLRLAAMLPIGRQIADALEAAHQKGIVYRD